MTKTPIADAVEAMLEAGIPTQMIVPAIRSMESALSTRQEVDGAAERRRAWDRGRKAMLPSNWREITTYVLKRDDYKCVYCGIETADLHCDHVFPLSRGGSNELSNLVAACAPCNLDKGNKLLSEWSSRP